MDEATFLAVQGMRAARPTQHGGTRTYVLAGLVQCQLCGRRLDSHWINGRPGTAAGTATPAPATAHQNSPRTSTSVKTTYSTISARDSPGLPMMMGPRSPTTSDRKV
ncbi:hypothetical protein [Amycolatopsis sp. NPDC051102]|uniref:hypothetical protein n=1 Tax=Amycolatopsis sp. NPDC051102 TaxID=3155163 RepID=UPI003421B2A4